MATIGQLAVSLVNDKLVVIQRGLQRWALGRHERLSDLIAEEVPIGYIPDRDARLRIAVCIRTGLQPTEYDRLSKLERLPYLEKTAESLGIDTEQYEDIDEHGLTVKPRFESPPCPRCGEKSRVASKRERTRYLKCTNGNCEHTWKSSVT